MIKGLGPAHVREALAKVLRVPADDIRLRE
jgi:hypothetical protein